MQVYNNLQKSPMHSKLAAVEHPYEKVNMSMPQKESGKLSATFQMPKPNQSFRNEDSFSYQDEVIE